MVNKLKNSCQKDIEKLKNDIKKVSFTIGKYLKHEGYRQVNIAHRIINYNLNTLLKLSEEMEEI